MAKARGCITSLFLLVAALLLGWAALAALYSPAFPEAARTPLTAAIVFVILLSFIPTRIRKGSRIIAVLLFCLVVWRWSALKPSNDRDWAPEVSREPWAEINGNDVTIHNVRDFHYRSEQDFDPKYETRTYHLDEMSGADIVASYWSGKNIAHIMTSFSFADRDFIAFSVETRKERGESYSTIEGFFRNFELVYIAGDERDLFGVRTNHRVPPEEVYVLRTRMPLQNARKVFLKYAEEMNQLRDRPAFYNTLTTNCTTQILRNVQSYSTAAKYSWQILFSGHVPELLHESGRLQPNMSLDEILARGLINERSKEGEARPDYSQYIRQGVPKPAPLKE